MIVINSERAKKLLANPVSFLENPIPGMKKYPGEEAQVSVQLELEGQNVKKLSFFGHPSDELKVLLEALASVSVKKNLSFLEVVTLRECEAFLRDRNSSEAILGLEKVHENAFKNIVSWIRYSGVKGPSQSYQFPSEKGPFHLLKLVDKVRELKAFFDSSEVLELYSDRPVPELVDVEDLTVFVHTSYESEEDRSRFEDLHILAVSVFQEESLNLIPEG